MKHPFINAHGTAAEQTMFEDALDKAQELPQGRKILDAICHPMNVHLGILPNSAFSSFHPKTGKVTVNISLCSPEMLIVILNGMMLRQQAALVPVPAHN